MGALAKRLNQPPQIEPEALPCPFCGSPAEIQFWHGGTLTKRMISCSGRANHDGYVCDVGPMVTGPTRGEALARWNRRA